MRCRLGTIVWYFFSDVYPPLHNGHKPFDPPAFWIRLWEGPIQHTEETETDAQPINHEMAAAAAPEVR